MLTAVRIDKYLWSVRIYKTRSIATEECKHSHVLVNDMPVKPSYNIKLGDKIQIKVPPIIKSFIVIGILDKRVSAVLSKQYITEITPEEEYNKLAILQDNRKSAFETHEKGLGRPTKKNRREIDKFKNDL
ncbi:MAG: S4 domain-containing protein [Bacteroidales bacterium]|nr:S4 domain-containing protein [Bacteroidales bacterium]MDD3859416.1 S4 domain-containing protein [Bacteroidales bacterium]